MEISVENVLNDCGFSQIKNNKEDIVRLVNYIKSKYNITNSNYEDIINFLIKFNNFSVDASVALRKSMKVYYFHGGFQVSLQYIIDEYEYLFDEYTDIQQRTNEILFPIGNGFSEILSISDKNKIYISDILVADNWDEFLNKLVLNLYKDL